MKHILMLATLCAAGMVSAVTFDWATTSGTVTDENKGGIATGFGNNQSFTVGVVFQLTQAQVESLSGTDKLVTVGRQAGMASDGGPAAAILKNGKGWNRYVTTAPGQTSTSGTFVAGENVLGISVVFASSSGTSDIYFTYWLNGVELGTLMQQGAGSPVLDTMIFDDLLVGANYYLGAGEQVVLPEPTALALLALGVVGLALRRRVA